jgi:hypothetical protein
MFDVSIGKNNFLFHKIKSEFKLVNLRFHKAVREYRMPLNINDKIRLL